MKDNILQLTPPPHTCCSRANYIIQNAHTNKAKSVEIQFWAPSPGQVYAGEFANIQLRWTSPLGPGRTWGSELWRFLPMSLTSGAISCFELSVFWSIRAPPSQAHIHTLIYFKALIQAQEMNSLRYWRCGPIPLAKWSGLGMNKGQILAIKLRGRNLLRSVWEIISHSW